MKQNKFRKYPSALSNLKYVSQIKASKIDLMRILGYKIFEFLFAMVIFLLCYLLSPLLAIAGLFALIPSGNGSRDSYLDSRRVARKTSQNFGGLNGL